MYDCFFPCVHVRGEMYSLIKNVDTNFNLKCYALIQFHQNEVILTYIFLYTNFALHHNIYNMLHRKTTFYHYFLVS